MEPWDYGGYSKNGYGYPPNNNREDIISVGDWILTLIILGIPFINIIMYFVWAFSSNANKNKQNFCRATLILAAIGIGLALLLGACSH